MEKQSGRKGLEEVIGLRRERRGRWIERERERERRAVHVRMANLGHWELIVHLSTFLAVTIQHIS